MDLAEMHKSSKGYKYFLVFVDHYSKWTYTIPLKNKEGSSVATGLEKIILPACHTLPQWILSDNGKEFKNREVSAVLKKYGIAQDFSPAYFPQNNGLAERTIGTIKSLLRATGGDWEENLAATTIAYNSTYHESIDMSPADVMVGKTARVIIPNKDLNLVKNHIPFKIGDKVLRKVHAAAKMGMK